MRGLGLFLGFVRRRTVVAGPPPGDTDRITRAGDFRITRDGAFRITR